MSNAITEAKSIEQVIDIINASAEGHYFGGSDTRAAEVMAGQYAWESAKEADYTDDASISAQLDYLAEAGAEFDFDAALENAISRREAQDA